MCDVQLECTTYPKKGIIFFVLRPHSYTSLQFLLKLLKPGNIEGQVTNHPLYLMSYYLDIIVNSSVLA